MRKIVLATKRHWNWKVFFVLIGLIIPASFAILPYAMHQQNVSFGWETLVLDRLVNSILPISLLGGIGLVLANRIGLGMPFVEAWVKREPVSYCFRQITAIAWISAVVLVLLSMFLHAFVFDPPLNALLEKTGIAMPEADRYASSVWISRLNFRWNYRRDALSPVWSVLDCLAGRIAFSRF